MNQTTINRLRFASLALACMVASSAGCTTGKSKWKFASWDVRKAVGLKKGDEKPDPEVPARLVSTWSEAVLNRTGETPKRGFGGRLAFFKADSEDPVRVNGQLVIYAFDETTRPQYETQPSRRYVFPAEQLAMYETPSKLGPSYSVWLPWDEAGGPGRKVSLIARFEPKDGAVIVSEQTKHYLAGPADGPTNSSEQQMAGVRVDPGVRTASYGAPTTASVATVPDGVVTHRVIGAREGSILTKPSEIPAAIGAANPTSSGNALDTETISLPRRLSQSRGAPLYEPRPTASQRTFETPHMPDVPQAAASRPATQSETQTGAAAATNPASRFQMPTSQIPAPVTIDPVTGYLAGPGLQQSQPRSGGYQSTQPLAQATPGAR